MWILLSNVEYESHNEFICAWKYKPTIQMLHDLFERDKDYIDVVKLKASGRATTRYGEDLTLTKYKLGVNY